MVIFIKSIYKLLLIFLSFFVYDLNVVDSNNEKIVLYDTVNIHDENNFAIYFKDNINSYDIEDLLLGYNIKINSYIIDSKKYYAKDSLSLINAYTTNLSNEEKIYYKNKGINIEGLNITCENNELMKLSSNIKIY